MQDWFLGLGISFVLMWPLTLRILLIFMSLGVLKPCTKVINSIVNASTLKTLQSGAFLGHMNMYGYL